VRLRVGGMLGLLRPFRAFPLWGFLSQGVALGYAIAPPASCRLYWGHSAPLSRAGRARDCRRDGGVTLGNLPTQIQPHPIILKKRKKFTPRTARNFLCKSRKRMGSSANLPRKLWTVYDPEFPPQYGETEANTCVSQVRRSAGYSVKDMAVGCGSIATVGNYRASLRPS